ncbi:MAG: c-type cytochrome [Longimicrobiales bacterium]
MVRQQTARTRQRARLGGFFFLCTMTAAACGRCGVALPALASSTVGDTGGLVARGAYIVRSVAVCGHCHAADPHKNPDGPPSGGLAFRNWRVGTARAANITSDAETGIGDWSEAQLVRAMRNGAHKDGHVLIPIMPYEWFHEMSDRDAMAVARYLKSQPPPGPPISRRTARALGRGAKRISSRPCAPASIPAAIPCTLSCPGANCGA